MIKSDVMTVTTTCIHHRNETHDHQNTSPNPPESTFVFTDNPSPLLSYFFPFDHQGNLLSIIYPILAFARMAFEFYHLPTSSNPALTNRPVLAINSC